MPSGRRLGRFPLIRNRQKKGYARKFGRYNTYSKRRFIRRPTYKRRFNRRPTYKRTTRRFYKRRFRR